MSVFKEKESCEESRGDIFCERIESKICWEDACDQNPFLAQRTLWHGYDVRELMKKRSLIDVIFLLLKGDLPNADQRDMLEHILIVLANPGPRHAATRSVMNASVFKVKAVNFLPIGVSLMSGRHLGSSEVAEAMQFLARNQSKDPEHVGRQLMLESGERYRDEGRLVPGFGKRFGEADPYVASLAAVFEQEFPQSRILRWATDFVHVVSTEGNGWFMTGLAAAIFTEIGFLPHVGAGIYQFSACPGLLAHGMEMSTKPMTAMPFVTDENYHYQGMQREECE